MAPEFVQTLRCLGVLANDLMYNGNRKKKIEVAGREEKYRATDHPSASLASTGMKRTALQVSEAELAVIFGKFISSMNPTSLELKPNRFSKQADRCSSSETFLTTLRHS